jgi:hypothetical protein
MNVPMIKWNLRLEALCNFRKLFVSDIILYLMNLREKIIGVRKIGTKGIHGNHKPRLLLSA